MNRHLTFRQYRRLDLFLFALMLFISELLILTAGRKWFPDQLYSVSATAAVTAIVLVRWGAFAGIHALLGGLVFCFGLGASPRHFVIYCLGNELSLAALFLIRWLGAEKIRTDKLFTLAFALCVTALMWLGRALCALLFGSSLDVCLQFFTTDTLSGVFTMVIVWIASRLDGIFEPQKSYLLRLHREMEQEKGGY